MPPRGGPEGGRSSGGRRLLGAAERRVNSDAAG
jgi:hypothetical protein